MAWRTGFKAAKHAKYGNKKAESNGIKFSSKSERDRYNELMLMQKAGDIEGLKLQESFILQRGFKTIAGETIRPIRYSCDFSYYDFKTGRNVVEDSKGFQTEAFLKSWKMMKYNYPEYEYRIT